VDHLRHAFVRKLDVLPHGEVLLQPGARPSSLETRAIRSPRARTAAGLSLLTVAESLKVFFGIAGPR